MQVITIESEAFKALMSQLDEIQARLDNKLKSTQLSEQWLNNTQVCELLYMGKRTLQTLRDSGQIPFSQVGSKIYYKAADIEKFLADNYQEGKGPEADPNKKSNRSFKGPCQVVRPCGGKET